MFKLAKKYLPLFKKEVIVGPIFKWIEAVFELIVPLVMAKIIDVGIPSSDKGYVIRMGLIMAGLGLVGLCSSLVCQYFASKASQGIGTAMRRDIFRHINAFSYSELDRFGTSSIINVVTNDVNQLQVAVAMLIRLVIRAPFLVLGAIVMSVFIDLQLSIIIIIATPLIGLVLYLIMSKSIPFYRSIQKKLDKVSLITRENLPGVRVVRAFSKQDTEKQRFEQANDDFIRSTVRINKLSALLSPAVSVILNFAIIAILSFGGHRVFNGALTQGEIIALINYINQIILAMIVVANLVVIFTKSAASAARVNNILDTEVTMKNGTEKLSDGIESIEFRDVSFSYNGTKNDIEGVTFSATSGTTVGVIGGTGAGKSTLVNLIPRFYDISRGKILINGRDITGYDMSSLRSAVGVVPQKAVLFSGTVRENLTMRKPDADDIEIMKAVKTAQAENVVERFSEGLSGRVEQGGKNLSGGQKQRLTIARALVGDPPVLILDDSASALDFATDAALRKALREDIDGKIVFIVSQRVSAVQGADFIIVLDNGKVMGIGSDEQLRRTCPTYMEICRSQQGGGTADEE